jgi:hypothetical protein
MNKCSCIKCKKEFSVKGIATHFLRAHEGRNFVKIGMFSCLICNKEFIYKQALTGHIQRSHTQLHLQKINFAKGNDKKRQMESDGHVFKKCVHTEGTTFDHGM